MDKPQLHCIFQILIFIFSQFCYVKLFSQSIFPDYLSFYPYSTTNAPCLLNTGKGWGRGYRNIPQGRSQALLTLLATKRLSVSHRLRNAAIGIGFKPASCISGDGYYDCCVEMWAQMHWGVLYYFSNFQIDNVRTFLKWDTNIKIYGTNQLVSGQQSGGGASGRLLENFHFHSLRQQLGNSPPRLLYGFGRNSPLAPCCTQLGVQKPRN